MNCNQNTPTPSSLEISYFTNPNCFDCGDGCGGQVYNTKCVVYTGPNLSCSGINTNDSVETALQKIDQQICSIIGDYSQYNMNCLPTWWGESITTEAEFVDAITAFTCNINTRLNTFIDTTFTAYQSTVNNRFSAIETPGIVCNIANVNNTDSLQTVLSKYCTSITALNDLLDISSVTWDSCLTIINQPSLIAEGFQLLADQICTVKGLVTNSQLPFFNNVGSCIGGTSNDSLVTTINSLKTRVCLTPTFNINTLNWTCLNKPSSVQTNLQDAFQTVLTTLGEFVQNKPTFSEDFIVSPNDVGDPCAGVTISLATPLNIDRFVAATAGDSNPGTLEDKLVEGTNVSLDYSNPSQVVINAVSPNEFKVKGNSGETNGQAGYLIDKLESFENSQWGIAAEPFYNNSTKNVYFDVSVSSPDLLWEKLFEEIKNNPASQAKFCELTSMCALGTTSQYRYVFTNNGGIIGPSINVFSILDVTNSTSPVEIATFSVTDGTNVPLTNYFNFTDYHQYQIIFSWTPGVDEWGGIKISNDITGYVYYDTSGNELYTPNPQTVPLTALPGNKYKIELFRGNNN